MENDQEKRKILRDFQYYKWKWHLDVYAALTAKGGLMNDEC